MSDTRDKTEALLPWTEQHLKSALINLIEAAKNSVRGPERGGSENAVSGIYQQIVAAWNTRAQPKPVEPNLCPDCYGSGLEASGRNVSTGEVFEHTCPTCGGTGKAKPEVAPDDEALMDAALEAMALYVRSPQEDDPQTLAYLARKKEDLRRHIAWLAERARNCAVASLGWENRWALKEAERMELGVQLEDAERKCAEAEARAEAAEAALAALEAALKDADGWLPIALCPTDGVWRLVKLSDGNEAVAAFDGVGLLSKKRWQTKVFLTHRPACPSPINDLVTQPARDVFLIADLENGVYPTHFRPNDTVFGLPELKGAAT